MSISVLGDKQCVCVRDCTLRIEQDTVKGVQAKSVYFMRGDIENFEECPPNFVYADAALREEGETDVTTGDDNIKGQAFSFADATEEVLMATEFDLDALKQFCAENYAIQIHHNTQKPTAVQQFIEARTNFIMGTNDQ